MDKLATASINSFGIAPKADVPPSEDPIFVLTSSQLQEIISRAIQPLKDRISDLEDMNAIRAREIAQDRQRIAKLEHPIKEPGKTEASRAERIEKYLLSRPDHKATFETLKGHLGIDKDLLNDAIKTLMASSPGRYGIIRTPGDKRKRTIIMLPK